MVHEMNGDTTFPCFSEGKAGSRRCFGAAGGFTLVEMLVSISVIALLISLLMPSLNSARRQARFTACMSNFHTIGLASQMYLSDNNDSLWRYRRTDEHGAWWWFGFESGGPGSAFAGDRPLDKSKGVLIPYFGTTDDKLLCPTFPYDDGRYFPKFSTPSATYGFNLHLGPPSLTQPTKRLSEYVADAGRVALFADAIHFDFFANRFNEGFYMQYSPGATAPSGYAHFRHSGSTGVVYLDGHAEAQPYRGQPFYREEVDGKAANLTDDGGNSKRVYGLR
jgi:prepilin-type N-terminal cleavage/methylation domain-containing protein/prepilin-type processing-associated H-X9-DG protein